MRRYYLTAPAGAPAAVPLARDPYYTRLVRILAADVGGTKTLLALYEGPSAGALREVARAQLESRSAAALSPLLAPFLAEHGPVDAAALGVAGPVEGDICRATNLPWVVDARALEAAHGLGPTRLLNDFEATALGLGALPAASLLELQAGQPDPGAPRAVLGAGTGLGVALVVPQPGSLPRVLPTEGGHADFAARDDLEVRLMTRLRAQHGRVSVERVLSGAGLGEVYAQVLDARGESPSAAIAERLDADPGAAVGEACVAGDPAAAEAVDRFLSLYGAEAGNVALRCLPFGGLYVAGGIAPKLRARIERGGFLEGMLAKGRMRRLLERVPVRLVLDPAVALLGARAVAADLLEPTLVEKAV